MESAHITIVIVHWNVPDLLADCLASIERETEGSPLKVSTVVVDSASDTTRYREVVSRFQDIRLIECNDNLGYAAGNNLGIEATSSEAVLILNPDTLLMPGSLEILWRTLQVSPHIGLVAPLLLNPDDSVQSAGYDFPGLMNLLCDLLPVPGRLYQSRLNGRHDGGDGVLPYAIDYPLGAAMLVRREAIDDVGGFDESYRLYCEEIDLCQRLVARGWTRLLAPSARIVHLGGQSTGQASIESRAQLWESRRRYYQQWTQPPKREIAARLIRAAQRTVGSNS